MKRDNSSSTSCNCPLPPNIFFLKHSWETTSNRPLYRPQPLFESEKHSHITRIQKNARFFYAILDGRLPRPGRSPEDEQEKVLVMDGLIQSFSLARKVLLTDEFGQILRTDLGWEGFHDMKYTPILGR